MHFREIKRVDVKTFGLIQDVLFGKCWFLLTASPFRFVPFQVTCGSGLKLHALRPGVCLSEGSLGVPGRPLLLEMTFGGTWTNIF